MQKPYFQQAVPVWLKGLQTEKNITAGFTACVNSDGSPATLSVATSGFYRVFVDGVFVSYGPARCAHGFYRVDELDLPLSVGNHDVAVEVVNYYINSFASLMQPGFVQMELAQGGRVIAATGGEGWTVYRLTDRVRKMQRFSYQRPMGESYRLTADVYGWRQGMAGSNAKPAEIEPTEAKQLVARGIKPFSFPEAVPEKRLSRGTFVNGVKPETYRKDRSLVIVGDPAKGELGGWTEAELELHLSDEIQEQQITALTPDGRPYTGETRLTAGELEILALPGEKTGFVTMDICCEQAGTLYFMVDETLRENGDVDALSMECLNVVRIDAAEGEYPFQTMESYGFRYLKLVCTAGRFTVRRVRVREMICPQPVTAAYTGDDPTLAAVFEAAKETFLQNSSDIFMDCPTRERAGWLCDSFFTARTEFALTGDNAVERVFLENFRLPDRFEFLPEGMLPMCYPADCLNNQFIPNWAMWFVLELEDYICRTGDAAFAEPFRPRVAALLKWFEQYENDDGLLERLPNWVFVEWSHANDLVQDINFPTNMLYARMLQAAAGLLGDPAPAEKAEKLIACIRERSFDGQFFTDNEVYHADVAVSSGERTETCQYYAFFTGVATPELYPALWEILLKDFGPDRTAAGRWPEIAPSNMFIGNYLRLELLRRRGEYAQLLEECIGYFHYMAERTGTLWENITDYASCNHGFASYAAVLILEAEANKKA